MEKIRVGILMHGIFYGGATRSLLFFLKGLESVDLEFIIYTTSCGSKEIKKELLTYVRSIKFVKLKQITSNQVFETSENEFRNAIKHNYSGFVNLLIKDRIRILHINTTVFPHIYKKIKKYTDIKIITHVRELIPPESTSLVSDYVASEIQEYSDVLVCISDNEAQRFHLFKKEMITLPNPVEFFDKNTIEHINETGIINVTMSSHFSKKKGHLVFLEALKILINKKLPDFRFLLVGIKKPTPFYKLIVKYILGISDYRTEVINYIKLNGLAQYVKLIPYTFNITPIIRTSDIIVRPSLSGDPWGRDVIEAMALGKPLIATGTSEFYIEDGVTGFLVAPNNPEELANKVSLLLNEPVLRNKMGEAGYEKIRKMCDISNYRDRIIGIYSSLINR